MRNLLLVSVVALFFLICGCCKDKNDTLCNSNDVPVKPFLEKYYVFTCGGNLYEYLYVMHRKSQIDSLTDCTFSPPIAFPIDETDMVYIMYGKMSYYRYDTFQTTLLKDTCARKLVYQIDMLQRDTTHWQFPGVMSIFCSVENIPPDYEVEVKYKYVPLGE